MFFKAGVEQTSFIHNKQNLTRTWPSFLHGSPLNKRHISCFHGLKVFPVENATGGVKALLHIWEFS